MAITSMTQAVEASDAADPERTRQALGALFAAANEFIPRSSTCQGQYGQRGRARLSDLLGTQFAYLYRGDNVVSGQCVGGAEQRCSVTISHRFSEDVSSTQIDFAVHAGRLRMSTLSCVMTP